MNALDIELAVARHFDYRQNIIVPNVSWGIYGLQYEADIVILRPSGYGVEIEIKISSGDIKADLRKTHRHSSILFRELWFAVPNVLDTDANIPEYAGILSVSGKPGKLIINRLRRPKINKTAVVWPLPSRHKLLHLGAMRIWGLKENLAALKQRQKKSLDNFWSGS